MRGEAVTRRIVIALLRLILRVFFRHTEVAGRERVPTKGPVIFALNHPNGLIDPLFILALAPRRVSLLGKSTLFKMPVIGFLARALDTLPVYRQQDAGADVSRNRETFARCRELLERGGTIALFPEGVSHSEPSLRPLKTGAARIALGAAAAGAQGLQIVPAGLYYTAKSSFRSSALLYFGEPVAVAPAALDANGEPPREAARELSDRLDAALREVTLNADHHQALSTVARAEEIFTAGGEPEQSLARELELRRQFVAGYARLRERAPERLAAVETRLRRYEEELRQAGLDVNHLSVPEALREAAGANAGEVVTRALAFLLLLPFALVGAVVNYAPYRLTGVLAVAVARKDDDILSTVKVLASLLLFPLTWIALAILGGEMFGWRAAVAALFGAPLAGYVAVRFSEEFDRVVGCARALLFFVTRRWFFKRLLAERNLIREEILSLAREHAGGKG
jgi:glycerol-3-phosphate O-acyltransferase / dihydroxyacetone phosphate acyltransferase